MDSNTATLDKLLPLIDTIYESATDGSRLQEVLEKITDYIGADAGAMAIGKQNTDNTRYLIVTPQQEDKPNHNLHTFTFLGPWRRALLLKEPGTMYLNHTLIPRASLEKGGFYQQWFSSHDITQGCTGYFGIKSDYLCYLDFGRSADKPPFSQEELAAVEQIMPHLKRAYQLNRFIDRLSILYDATQERYDQFTIGIILLDDKGQIIFHNAFAKSLLKAPGGVCMADGRICLEDEAENTRLYEMIHTMSTGIKKDEPRSNAQLSASRQWNKQMPLSLSITPYTNRLATKTLMSVRGRVMVVVLDPEQQPAPRKTVMEGLYKLSPQEAELSCALAEGETLAQVSERTGVSKETLRSQLKRVFQKTGTHRQSELVKLVLSSPSTFSL